jgi:hypothetical protein
MGSGRIGRRSRPPCLSKGKAVTIKDAQRQRMIRYLIGRSWQACDLVAQVKGSPDTKEHSQEQDND